GRASLRVGVVAEFHYPRLQPASDRRREDGQPRQQRLMADVVETPADVGVEHPSTGPLLAEGGEQGLDRIHRAAPGAEAVRVCFEAAFPFGFQRLFHERLHHAVPYGGYPQGPSSSVALRDVDPPNGERLVALEAQAGAKQRRPGIGCVAHHAIDARRVLPLVFLRDAPYRGELGRGGSHGGLLKAAGLPPVPTLSGSVNPLLQPPYRRLHRAPVDAGPQGRCRLIGPFSEDAHRLTSPMMQALRRFLPARTSRTSAPFRVG